MEDGFPKQTFVSICHRKIVKKILHSMREQLFGGLWLNLEAKPCFDYFWLQQPASASVLYSWSMWETTRRPGIHHILYDIAHTHISYNNYIIILYNMKEHCYFMHIIYIYIYVDVMCTSVYHAEWCWGPRRDADGMPQQDAAQPWRFFGPAGVNWKTRDAMGCFGPNFEKHPDG